MDKEWRGLTGMARSDSTYPFTSSEWSDAFHYYEEVINSCSDDLKLRATIRVLGLLHRAPKHLLLLAIPIFVGLLERPSEASNLREAAAFCLKCIICNDRNHELGTLVCVPWTLGSLVRLLLRTDGRCQRYIIKCLWGVVTYVRESRVHIFASGGLEVVIELLSTCVDSRRIYLLEIVSALALVRDVRRALFSLGKLHLLVEAVKGGSMVSKERAAQAIGLLGVIRRARRTLVTLGAIPPLVDLLRDGDCTSKLVAANALGVILSHVDYIRPVSQAGVIPLYAELLRGSEPLGREIAEDAFCVLAVAESNAVEIAEHLVEILQEDNVEARAAAADVFWDLSGYKHSVSIIRGSGAIPILVQLLRDDNTDVREKVSGAIAQIIVMLIVLRLLKLEQFHFL